MFQPGGPAAGLRANWLHGQKAGCQEGCTQRQQLENSTLKARAETVVNNSESNKTEVAFTHRSTHTYIYIYSTYAFAADSSLASRSFTMFFGGKIEHSSCLSFWDVAGKMLPPAEIL